jgi:hypothetical protein
MQKMSPEVKLRLLKAAKFRFWLKSVRRFYHICGDIRKFSVEVEQALGSLWTGGLNVALKSSGEAFIRAQTLCDALQELLGRIDSPGHSCLREKGAQLQKSLVKVVPRLIKPT